MGIRPKKYQKFPLFGKESSRRGDYFDRFRKFWGSFYTNIDPTLVFQTSCDSDHRLRSYCWETVRPSIRPNFSVHPHPVGKLCVGSETDDTILMASTSTDVKLGRANGHVGTHRRRCHWLMASSTAHCSSPHHSVLSPCVVSALRLMPLISGLCRCRRWTYWI